MNYRVEEEQLSLKIGTKYSLFIKDRRLSFEEVINLWQTSADFRFFYTEILFTCEYDAFYWEHPPNKLTTISQDYEFVLIESRPLSRVKPDPQPFRAFINGSDKVASFFNLGKDARLVCPKNESELTNYSSLSKFVRTGDSGQVDLFWQKVGEEYALELCNDWKWLSTSGLGVYWLHVRIDTIPKYYSYKPYREINE